MKISYAITVCNEFVEIQKLVLFLLDHKRKEDEIGFAVLRGGDVVGEHSVLFCNSGERIELTHKATDRSIFASGALRASYWAANADPGLYSLADVLENGG